jgi:hypothetical protein
VLRRFDSDPALCLPPLPPDESGGPGGGGGGMRIALSESQEAQIREIFNLFDTDGGGSIDRREMDFAMVALGFQSKGGQANAATAERIEAIVADGTVTLEEFSALMTGEPAPPVLFAAAACNDPAGHARMCAGLVCPALLDGDTREICMFLDVRWAGSACCSASQRARLAQRCAAGHLAGTTSTADAAGVLRFRCNTPAIACRVHRHNNCALIQLRISWDL